MNLQVNEASKPVETRTGRYAAAASSTMPESGRDVEPGRPMMRTRLYKLATG